MRRKPKHSESQAGLAESILTLITGDSMADAAQKVVAAVGKSPIEKALPKFNVIP